MGKEKKNWHPNFIKYMNFIVSHNNYARLPIERKANGELSWIATAQGNIGKARKAWAENKARELNIPIEPGFYAKVMLEIHPTKKKVCQVCGKEMSLLYIYPNKWLIKALRNTFGIDFEQTQSIYDILQKLTTAGICLKDISVFLESKFKLSNENNDNINQLIEKCEEECRLRSSNLMGPGAMSNFPDRFDGFHTYNRCCRAEQDKGRHAENMKTYTKDRRAYEYWSDGNIHAANKFMGSSFFDGTSADHVGAISLGFIHDPRYLRPMLGGDNSSKRDRLSPDDLSKILKIYSHTRIYPMSWYSAKIFDHLADEYIAHGYHKNPDEIENYRLALKQNMVNFMEILWIIVDKCGDMGKDFLIKTLLEPKHKYFEYAYEFNEFGEITKTLPRLITDATRKEIGRFIRIAFESIKDFHIKENRNVKTSLDSQDFELLDKICKEIQKGKGNESIYDKLQELIEKVQDKLLEKIG